MVQPTNRRLATEAYVSDVAATKVNSSTYTAGIAGKQDAATLDVTVAGKVATVGTATDVALREAQQPAALAKLFAGLAARKVRPCRIAFAGSSTTQGINASAPANRYVDQLIARFQAAFPSGLGSETSVVASTSATWGTLTNAVGVHGYNAGEGNTTSATYLTAAELTSIADLDPRAVFHMVGSNDYATGVAIPTFKANVQANVTALKGAIPGPCVQVLVHSYPRMDIPSPANPWSAYGAALAQIAAADPDNVVFLDLTRDYQRVGIPTGTARTAAANAVTVRDTFNRTATVLGNSDTGQLWTADGTWTVTPAVTYCTAGNGLGYIEASTGDMDVSVTVTMTSGTGAVGMLLHSSDFNNRFVYYLNAGAGTWNLGKFDASSTLAGLTSGSGVTTSGGASHVLRAVSNGATITMYIDGGQVGTYTMTGAEQTKFKAITKAGLRYNPAVSGALANFTVRAVNGATVTVADPLNLIDTDGIHSVDAGHAFLAAEIARPLGLLSA